ncbi:MAG: hypothetical protein PWP31_478 [Clostridia bacterium]|nr:hypothetical protein [Clostridia bacterium]
MKPTRVYLVRHGETEWNNTGRYQGHSDVMLSSKGKLQANLLKKRFDNINLDCVFTSDLKRATETASIISKSHGINVETLKDLREINFGAWEGLTYKEITTRYPKEWDEWRQDPGNVVIPGGESFNQVKERVLNSFNKIIEQEKGRDLLIVGHGGCLRVLICSVLGLDLNGVWRFSLDNTGVSIIDCYNEDKILVLLNDSHHLEEIGEPNESGIL